MQMQYTPNPGKTYETLDGFVNSYVLGMSRQAYPSIHTHPSESQVPSDRIPSQNTAQSYTQTQYPTLPQHRMNPADTHVQSGRPNKAPSDTTSESHQ